MKRRNQHISCLLFSLFLLLCCPLRTEAQIGVSLSYRYINAPYWGLLLGENSTIFKNGHGFSADYRIPLSEVRMSLMPEVGFSKFSYEIPADIRYPDRTFLVQFFNFQTNANIYALDFFKKIKDRENMTAAENVARSFFVQISPGVGMVYLNYRAANEDMLLPPRRTAFFLGAGAGFDIHLPNYLTLTPMIRTQHYPGVRWEGLSEIRDEQTGDFFREETYVNQFAFTLRMELRLH